MRIDRLPYHEISLWALQVWAEDSRSQAEPLCPYPYRLEPQDMAQLFREGRN